MDLLVTAKVDIWSMNLRGLVSTKIFEIDREIGVYDGLLDL